VIDFVPSRRGHFRLESGFHTDVWLELDRLFAEPKRVAPMADALAASLRSYEFDAICGAMSGGAFLAQLLAHALDKEFWFTERHVTNGSASYVLPRAFAGRAGGRRVAIVDDVMSAGSAMRGTYDALLERGAHIVVVAALLILGREGADFFTRLQIPIEAPAREAFNLWQPSICRLCAEGVPVESTV
jgi:orotate phosphoribosyltransferase